MKRVLLLIPALFLLFTMQGCVYIDSDDDWCSTDADCAGDDSCVDGECTGSDRRSRDSGSDSDDDEPECQRDSDCGPGLVCDDFECEDR